MMHLQKVAALDHEVLDHAVEAGPLVPLRLSVAGPARQEMLNTFFRTVGSSSSMQWQQICYQQPPAWEWDRMPETTAD